MIDVSSTVNVSLPHIFSPSALSFVQNAKGWCLMNDKRLKQMGVTVRNASAYLEMKREREQQATTAARVLEDMSV